MDAQKLKQILCQHPKKARQIYCECNPEFYISGHICGECLKIFDLKISAKNRGALPKIDSKLFDSLGRD